MNNFTIFRKKSTAHLINQNSQDVLEFRSESKSPFYSQFNNNLNRSISATGPVPSKLIRKSASFSQKSKLLPPLTNSNSQLVKSLESSYSTSSSQSQSESPKHHDTTRTINLDLDASYPCTENKKRSPKKIDSIDPELIIKANTFNRDLDTPVTIDILSESGRYSRQSLDPLTSRETVSRFSNRPTSFKEPLFRKPSGKLKSLRDVEDSDEMEKSLETPKLKFNEHSLVVQDAEKNLIETDRPDSSNVKLDTIKESLGESAQNNVKKIKTKDKVVPKPINNSNNPSLAKPPSGNLNNKLIKKVPESLKPPIRQPIPKSKPNLCIKPVNNTSQCNNNTNTNKNNLNLELYNPTSCQNSIQNQAKPNQILPTKMDSSRIIEKNRKTSAKLSSIIKEQSKETDVFVESYQSTLTNVTNCTSGSKSILGPINDLKLEICSSRVSLYEKPSSAKSIAQSCTKIGEPKQPLISTMFEGYPQPFAAKSTENNSAISLISDSITNKKKIIKKPKSSLKQVKTATPNSAGTKLRIKTSNVSKGVPLSKNQKNLKSKILITAASNKSDQNNFDIDLQKEIVNDYENYLEDEFDVEDGGDLSSSSSSLDYLSENENFSKEKNSTLKSSKSETSLIEKSLLTTSLNLSTSDTNLCKNDSRDELTHRINKDLVKSFEDKVLAIYTKFDNLLMIQENKLENKESVVLVKELSVQKAQFSDEIAKELSENINFNKISNDPDLAKRLEKLYNLVKTNSDEKPPIQILKTNEDNNLPRRNSISIKSNADIREVYSIVNSLSKTNSNNLSGKLTKVYKIPVNLTDKINTLMVTLPNPATEHVTNSINNKLNKSMTTTTNTYEDVGNALIGDVKNSLNQFKTSSRLKFNFSNKLDSIGNESSKSSFSHDSNSLSYHYDVKYRNDRSKSPINLHIENENDFQFKWKRGTLLGKGAFGSVYQAMLSTGEIIAVKQIEMEESDPARARKEYDSVREEVKILRELEHINIVQFMGTMLESNIVNIFMELIPGGTIEALLKTFGPFEEDLFKIFTSQILEGVNYIHSRNVVHRDIKGKNIMLMSTGIIKLIDFGCAKRLKKNQSSNSIKQLLKSLKGTPYWMSPEVIRETGHGSKADIWSIGATIFEMATGMPPWGNLSPLSAIYAIGSGESPPPDLPDKFSNEAKDFVRSCLTRDPDFRPSAAELLQYQFLKQNI